MRRLTALSLSVLLCACLPKDDDEDDDGTGTGAGGWDLGTDSGVTGGDGGGGDGGGPDGGGDGGGPDGGTDDCDARVDETWPEDGARDAYHRTTVTFEVSRPVPEGEVTLETSTGTPVSGTSELSSDRDTFVFTPDSPLSPLTDHIATLDFCGGKPAIDFRTSELGETLAFDPTGRTYLLDLDSAEWIAPAGIGDLISGAFENGFLVYVVEADSSITLRIAMTQPGETEQDRCIETFDLAADFTDAPYWTLGPEDVALDIDGTSLTFQDMQLSGTFASDASWYGGSSLQGVIDYRELAPSLEDLIGTDDPGELCSLMAGFGVSCEACPSDGEEFCMSVHLTDVVANGSSAVVVERDAADIAEDRDCK